MSQHALLLKPYFQTELGIAFFKIPPSVPYAELGERTLLLAAPEQYLATPSGKVDFANFGGEQTACHCPELAAFVAEARVKRALGGEEGLLAWLNTVPICQCRDGKYCHSQFTTHAVPNVGALRVCWHHDRLLIEGQLNIADFRQKASANWVKFAVSRIQRDLNKRGEQGITFAELVLWALRMDLLSALPDKPLRELLGLPPALDLSKESSIGFETSPVATAKSRLAALNLTADDEPPLSFMRFPKPVTFKSPKWLHYVKAQTCVCCGRPADDPHHLIGIGHGKMGGKAHDLLVIPLCRQHHNELHRDVGQFEAQYGSQAALFVAFLDKALAVEALNVSD